ncbi:MAG: glycogen-binding domain-containing protein [Gemmatimonadota bacterium]|jgi:hypothetical protein
MSEDMRTPGEEKRVRELLGLLREDVKAPPELYAGVMREISKERPSLAVRAVEWLLRPRLVPISPAVAGLAVAALATLILLRPSDVPVVLPTTDATASAERVVTRFVLVAPGASSVHVTGDFNSWSREGIALEDLRGSGIWTGDIALPPGVHQYTFVLDGSEYVADPSAVMQVDDGYGQTNSILVVPGEGEV